MCGGGDWLARPPLSKAEGGGVGQPEPPVLQQGARADAPYQNQCVCFKKVTLLINIDVFAKQKLTLPLNIYIYIYIT